MPTLVPTNRFLTDLDGFRRQPELRKKIAKSLKFLETNPLHPGLHLERIFNDTSAWSIRIDRGYRIAIDPTAHLAGGNPDWSADILLLRVLSHDDLYKHPR